MIFLAFVAALAAVSLRWLAFNVRRDLRSQGSPTASRLNAASPLCPAAAVLFAVFASIVVVPAGHIGVQVLFGRVKPAALTEGIQFINPFVDVVEMSVRTETYTMSA